MIEKSLRQIVDEAKASDDPDQIQDAAYHLNNTANPWNWEEADQLTDLALRIRKDREIVQADAAMREAS